MLSVEPIATEPGWIRSIDFARADLGCRTDQLQIREVQLQDLGWSVHFLIAPMEHGLLQLRVYDRLRRSILSHFNVLRDGVLDEATRKCFDKCLRRMRIPTKSSHAFHCFGQFPRGWGSRYFPKKINVRAFSRLETIAVPIEASGRLRIHLQRQLSEFGDRCIFPVDEDRILFSYGDNITESNRKLMLDHLMKLDDADRAATLDRLRTLVASEVARMEFRFSVDPAIPFAGIVQPPYTLDLAQGHEQAWQELYRLRLELCRLLGWPQTLEYARLAIQSEPEWVGEQFLPQIEEALGEYMVIHEDPLGAS